MPVLYFFGDSWTSEKCEVEDLYRRGIYRPEKPIQSVPAIVSEITGLDHRNYSVPGSSQEHMLYRLLESDIKSGDHAIFALTAPSRRFFLDDDATPTSVHHDAVSSINDHNDSWRASCAVNGFYQQCIIKGVTPWFFCLFNRSRFDNNEVLKKNWERVPADRWLLPPTTCAVAEWVDPGWFARFEEYMNSDFYDWLRSDSPEVSRMIHPCQEHPNLEGRWAIARKIAEKIL